MTVSTAGSSRRGDRAAPLPSLLVMIAVAGCPSGSGPADAGPQDAALDAGDPPRAAQYCEITVDLFCPFYLRCGRIAAETPAACAQAFLEMCNEVYEPRYAALEAAGLLQLSPEGIEACRTHLAEVPCDHHLLDLEGPCRGVWRGQAAAGAACGVGIESLVCDQATTCAVDLSLCGSCEPAAGTGEPCGEEVRCRYPDLCVEALCVAPALPGEACGDTRRCITGASCDQGLCVARVYVAVAEACDADHRCPYGSSCLGGSCRRDALLGEACGELAACASGTCGQDGTCAPLSDEGEPCGAGGECRSGRCPDGTCASLLSECL